MNGEERNKDAWDTWTQDLNNFADITKSNYIRNLKRFLKRWGITAGELYEMRKADLQSGEPMERKRIERMVKTSMSEIVKEGFAAGTARSTSKAVSSFFESMGMDLHFKSKDMPRAEYKGQLAFTKPQIVKIYEEMIHGFTLRNRALLLTAKDSGLRVGDLKMMDYGSWLQAKTIRNEQGKTFRVFDPELTQKVKVIAYIHLGPESIAAIEEYLNDRQDRGDVLTEESPLFTGQNGERMGENAITLIMSKKAQKLGMKKSSAHSLRKFHRTRLEGAGMPESWVKKLQGKKTDPYTRPEDDISEKYPGFNMLTERYVECYDALRVLEKPRDKKENERLREELERSNRTHDNETQELRHELAEVKQALTQLTELYEPTTVDDRLSDLQNQINQLVQKFG